MSADRNARTRKAKTMFDGASQPGLSVLGAMAWADRGYEKNNTHYGRYYVIR
jgi:hypothetical protein